MAILDFITFPCITDLAEYVLNRSITHAHDEPDSPEPGPTTQSTYDFQVLEDFLSTPGDK